MSDSVFLTRDEVLELHETRSPHSAANSGFGTSALYRLREVDDRLADAILALATRELDKVGLAKILREMVELAEV